MYLLLMHSRDDVVNTWEEYIGLCERNCVYLVVSITFLVSVNNRLPISFEAMSVSNFEIYFRTDRSIYCLKSIKVREEPNCND